MIKKIFSVILVLIFSFLLKANVFSISIIPVENIFSDIKTDYKYYLELQTLYDKGIIEPESDGGFHPDKLLNRDEFVGIAEETSCKKCIIPDTEKYFLDKYKQEPFFDVGLNNKYFYCISDAKENKFVLGYKLGDSCNDGTKQDGKIPFCINNNIKLEEALAVIMRMSGIMTNLQAEKIISGIKNGQKYPDLALDMKLKYLDGTINSFYPYFKKALEYEVIDYDINGDKKIYKLVEKKGNFLRPNTLITKQDFLKMAFIALKANSCNVVKQNNLAIKIEVFDKTCNIEKSNKGLCKLSDLKDSEDIFDFSSEIGGICDKGINENTGYVWRFVNQNTGKQIIKYGKYIDNYKFLESGKYKIFLRVTDKCGNSGEVYNTIDILDREINNLSVTIKANPISGNGPLEVNFEGIINGGLGPYKYNWDFGDGNFGDGMNVKHIFLEEGIYEVELIIIDSNGDRSNATVLIEVLNNICSNDSDLDGINDCLDKCPLVKGDEANSGCPIFIKEKIRINVGNCLKEKGNSSFIFGNITCNSCPCAKSIDFRATIRECDTIIPAITSPSEKDIYSRGKLFQIKK